MTDLEKCAEVAERACNASIKLADAAVMSAYAATYAAGQHIGHTVTFAETDLGVPVKRLQTTRDKVTKLGEAAAHFAETRGAMERTGMIHPADTVRQMELCDAMFELAFDALAALGDATERDAAFVALRDRLQGARVALNHAAATYCPLADAMVAQDTAAAARDPSTRH